MGRLFLLGRCRKIVVPAKAGTTSANTVIARSKATKQSSFVLVELWIASLSLSSGAHSRDPLARNDDLAAATTPQ
jgi:hypothetical protein